jgi:hypothetical protein
VALKNSSRTEEVAQRIAQIEENQKIGEREQNARRNKEAMAKLDAEKTDRASAQ